MNTFFQVHVPFTPKKLERKFDVCLQLYFGDDGSEEMFFVETEKVQTEQEKKETNKRIEDLEQIYKTQENKEIELEYGRLLRLSLSSIKIENMLLKRPILRYNNVTDEEEQIFESYAGAINEYNGMATFILFEDVLEDDKFEIDYEKFYSDREYSFSIERIHLCFITSISKDKCTFFVLRKLANDCMWFSHHRIIFEPQNEETEFVSSIINMTTDLYDDVNKYSELHSFFDYHLFKYDGETSEFLDYIESIFFNNKGGTIGGSHEYDLTIANWIKNKREESDYIASLSVSAKNKNKFVHRKNHGEIDKDFWMQWVLDNSGKMEEYYPNIKDWYDNHESERQPSNYLTSIIISIPDRFAKWKDDVANLDAILRQKRINEYITFIDYHLSCKYEEKILCNAIESVREDLNTQLGYWKTELENAILEYDNLEKSRMNLEIDILTEKGEIILTSANEKFTIPQIALIYYYDDLLLTDKNKNNEVSKYGWSSGQKLYLEYLKFKKGDSDRLYRPTSTSKIRSIIPYLTTERGIRHANKDLEKIGVEIEE